MKQPDVVVVGGGPAGLAAAIVCATSGLRVTLVERHTFPVDKPCGEGLLPNGVAALARIGVDLNPVTARGRAITGIRYISANGRSAEASFLQHTALGIRRTGLSDVLAAHARTLPTLDIVTDVKASVSLDHTGRPQVDVRESTMRPKLVVGADGLHSHTRDAVGIAHTRGSSHRWGCRQHFDVAPWTSHVEVYFGTGFEIYVTPVASGTNVAVLWDATVVRVGGACSPVATLLARVPSLATRLQGHAATDRPRARGPFDVRVPRPWKSGVLLIGDAAGYLDALTGEGVGLAFEQAALLADSVVPVLQQTSQDALVHSTTLAQFTRAARAQSRSYRLLTQLLLRVARYPALTEGLIGVLASSPATFTHLLEVNMGHRAMWHIPFSSREASS